MCGGMGTRLSPITKVTNKHLLLIYDKPLVYYPLTSAILSGVTDLLVISSKVHIGAFESLFGNGTQWGIKIRYMTQKESGGIPQAFLMSDAVFDRSKETSLFLGDNLFFGTGLGQNLFTNEGEGLAKIIGVRVNDPTSYGVAILDGNGLLEKVIEKPRNNVSNIAITGIYSFPADVFEKAKLLPVSDRGELEIVDLINMYIEEKRILFRILPRGAAWLDTGTPENLLKASQFVSAIQNNQGLLVGSPDEAAWRMGLIDTQQLEINSYEVRNSEYGKVLHDLILRDSSCNRREFKR